MINNNLQRHQTLVACSIIRLATYLKKNYTLSINTLCVSNLQTYILCSGLKPKLILVIPFMCIVVDFSNPVFIFLFQTMNVIHNKFFFTHR